MGNLVFIVWKIKMSSQRTLVKKQNRYFTLFEKSPTDKVGRVILFV